MPAGDDHDVALDRLAQSCDPRGIVKEPEVGLVQPPSRTACRLIGLDEDGDIAVTQRVQMLAPMTPAPKSSMATQLESGSLLMSVVTNRMPRARATMAAG